MVQGHMPNSLLSSSDVLCLRACSWLHLTVDYFHGLGVVVRPFFFFHREFQKWDWTYSHRWNYSMVLKYDIKNKPSNKDHQTGTREEGVSASDLRQSENQATLATKNKSIHYNSTMASFNSHFYGTKRYHHYWGKEITKNMCTLL